MKFKDWCYMYIILTPEKQSLDWKYTKNDLFHSNYFLYRYLFHINCYKKLIKKRNINIVNCYTKYLNSMGINDVNLFHSMLDLSNRCPLDETYKYDLFYMGFCYSNFTELKYLIAVFDGWYDYVKYETEINYMPFRYNHRFLNKIKNRKIYNLLYPYSKKTYNAKKWALKIPSFIFI